MRSEAHSLFFTKLVLEMFSKERRKFSLKNSSTSEERTLATNHDTKSQMLTNLQYNY
ncbi:unnamed protein product, partial [Dovyalis caffra]